MLLKIKYILPLILFLSLVVYGNDALIVGGNV